MSVIGSMSQKDRGTALVLPNLQTPPDTTGFFQNIGAGFTSAKAGPHSTQNARAIYESRSYDQIIAALNAEGEKATDYVESPLTADSPLRTPVSGERIQGNKVYVPVQRSFANPFSEGPSLTRDVNPIQNLYMGGDAAEQRQIWDAVRRVRARKPGFLNDFPDPLSISATALRERQADQARASEVTSRATTLGKIGGFIGGAAGSVASLDPEAVFGFFTGSVGEAAGKSVARQVLTHATEGAGLNAAASIVGVPAQAADAERMGQRMTPADVVHSVEQNVVAGAVLGGSHVVVPEALKATGKVAGAVVGKVAENLPSGVRDPIVAASIRAGTVKDRQLLYQFQRQRSPYSVIDTSTPEERAAAHVVTRDVETQEQSPLHPSSAGDNNQRLSAIAGALGVDLSPPEVPTPAPVQTPTVRDSQAGGRKPASFADATIAAEGKPIRNPASSADGYGQFTEGTWLSVAPHVADTKGLSREQILQLRHDKTIAARATDYYAAQNSRYLRIRGLEDSPGNLSLAHFLGPADAAKVLKADPSMPVENIIDPRSFAANRKLLEGKSADELIAWAHKRIGASVDHPPARPDAVPDEGFDYSSPVPYTVETLRPDELPPTSAQAPTDEPFNPMLSDHLLVWEAADGRRELIDGGKRLAHARAQDDQTGISLPTVVLKEADGIPEEMAMLVGKLKNVNLGTTSLEEAAGTLADLPEIADALKSPQFRREIAAIAQLPYDRFGDVVNGRLDPVAAAQIGEPTPRFDSDPVKAIAALPDEQFRALGAALGVRRKFIDMRAASRFLDNKKLADVRAAYLETVGQGMEVPHGETATLTRPATAGGGPREPSGGEGRDLAAEAPDANLPSGGGPSLFDRAVTARDQAEKFSDPAGPEAKEQTALIEHDLRAEAEGPDEKAAYPSGETEHLFDLPSTGFRLSEEGERPQSLKDILEQVDADEAAAKALRDCL